MLSSEDSISPMEHLDNSGSFPSMHSSEEDKNAFVDKDKPTLLVANDNYFLLNAIEELSSPFFQVSTANNGLEAYEIVIDKPRYFFDAILLDI